jgi:hypothetical protein
MKMVWHDGPSVDVKWPFIPYGSNSDPQHIDVAD